VPRLPMPTRAKRCRASKFGSPRRPRRGPGCRTTVTPALHMSFPIWTSTAATVSEPAQHLHRLSQGTRFLPRRTMNTNGLEPKIGRTDFLSATLAITRVGDIGHPLGICLVRSRGLGECQRRNCNRSLLLSEAARLRLINRSIAMRRSACLMTGPAEIGSKRPGQW
jgi:hypothetical protein